MNCGKEGIAEHKNVHVWRDICQQSIKMPINSIHCMKTHTVVAICIGYGLFKKNHLVCELLDASLIFTDSLHCFTALLLLRLHLILKLPHLKTSEKHLSFTGLQGANNNLRSCVVTNPCRLSSNSVALQYLLANFSSLFWFYGIVQSQLQS